MLRSKSRCQATGSISSDENNKQFQLRRLHNHQVQPSNTEIRELLSTIGQRYVQQFARPYSARSIYVEAIVSHPEGAKNYIFSQTAETMRQIRSVFPQTPRNLQHFNELMQMENNKHFNMSFQKQPSLFYQGPIIVNGLFVGAPFCMNTSYRVNRKRITECKSSSLVEEIIENFLKTSFLDYNIWMRRNIQDGSQNVPKSFPMVYAILTGQIRFLENQNNLEFKQVSQNLKIRSGVSSRARIRNKNTLEEDDAPNHILTFLRRTGHKVDGYITQQIGTYPDLTHFEQLAFVVRYVMDNGDLQERLLSVEVANDETGKGLFGSFCNICEKYNLNWKKKLCAQAFDGASYMQGKYRGLKSYIQNENPRAVNVWCFAHILNLVVVNVCESSIHSK
ncbi:hypothetical protein ACI65C_013669 [Semiaphis heraclei]